jgi:hypothetical protein
VTVRCICSSCRASSSGCNQTTRRRHQLRTWVPNTPPAGQPVQAAMECLCCTAKRCLEAARKVTGTVVRMGCRAPSNRGAHSRVNPSVCPVGHDAPAASVRARRHATKAAAHQARCYRPPCAIPARGMLDRALYTVGDRGVSKQCWPGVPPCAQATGIHPSTVSHLRAHRYNTAHPVQGWPA